MNGQILRLAPPFGRRGLLALCLGLALACSNGGELGGGKTGIQEPNALQGGNTTGNATPDGQGQGNPAVTDPNAPEPTDPAGQGNLTPIPLPAPADAASFRLLGRMPADGSQILSWTASGGEFAFAGTSAEVSFAAVNGNNVVGVFADGNRLTSVAVTADQPNVRVGPLANGNHVVRVLKLSEARLGTLAWRGYTTDGQALPLAVPARRIAFVGDSIAAGYGVNGNAPCANTPALEDGTKSFAYLAATALGADPTVIAWAGKGLTRNDTADNSNAPVLLPALWQRANGADAASVYTFPAAAAPQVVVLALGTNDFEYMQASAQGNLTATRPAPDHNAFVAAYASFVRQVEASYPQASFVLCTSPLLSDFYPAAADAQHTALLNDLQAVAAQVGTQKVSVVDFATLTDAQRTGCGAHPSAAAHQLMATQLVNFVRQKLTW